MADKKKKGDKAEAKEEKGMDSERNSCAPLLAHTVGESEHQDDSVQLPQVSPSSPRHDDGELPDEERDEHSSPVKTHLSPSAPAQRAQDLRLSPHAFDRPHALERAASGESHFGFALLVMNMQRDFFEGGALREARCVDVDLLDRILEFRESLPWTMVMHAVTHHPANRANFQSMNIGSRPFTQVTNENSDAVYVVPDHCVMGTPGAKMHSGMRVGPHDVVVETGLSPDAEDIGPFSTAGTLRLESVAEELLSRANVTDLVIVGVDVDGEAILASIDVLNECHINVHIVQDLCETVVHSDMWSLCEDMGAHLLASSAFRAEPRWRKFQEHHANSKGVFKGFRLSVFDDLLALVKQRDFSLELFNEFCEKTKCGAELAAPHPTSGLYFVHYLAAMPSANAALLLDKLIGEGVVGVGVEAVGTEISPLMSACAAGNTHTVNTLLKHSPDLGQSDSAGRTSMMYAIQSCNLTTVRALLNCDDGGPRLLLRKDSNDRTCLHLACQHTTGGLEVLQVVWDKMDKRALTDGDADVMEWTFFNYAVRFNLHSYLRQVLDTAPRTQSLVMASAKLVSSLELAAAAEHDRKNGTRVSEHDNLLGQLNQELTQPRQAVQAVGMNRQLKNVEAILMRVAQSGATLLHQAAWQRKLSVLDVLLSHYKQLNLLDITMNNGFTALDICAEEVDPICAFKLVQAGCSPRQRAGTPMYHLCTKAILLGRAQVVARILNSVACGVNADMQLVDIVHRTRTVRACTSSVSSAASNLHQVAYSCAQCEEQRPGGYYCSVCAIRCHSKHRGLEMAGFLPFHCACPNDCSARAGEAAFDAAVESITASMAQIDAQKRMTRSIRFVADDDSVGALGSVRPSVPKQKSFRKELSNERNSARQMDGDVVSAMAYRDFVRLALLMNASREGKVDVIDELVKHVDPDLHVDTSRDCAIHHAARANSLEGCLHLKRRGVRMTLANSDGLTPLHIAAASGNREVCEVVAHGNSLLKLDSWGLTPIHHACRNNHEDVLEFLVFFLRNRTRVPVELNMLHFGSSNKPSTTPKLTTRHSFLHQSTGAFRHSNVCDVTDVPQRVRQLQPGECEGHASPLHLAVRYGHVGCAQLLMNNGANPLAYDATGFTPYQTAIWEQYVTRRLLKMHQASATRKAGGTTPHSRYFEGRRLTAQGRDVQQQFETLNRRIPHKQKVLSVDNTHSIIDAMGLVGEVRRSRNAFALRFLIQWVLTYLAVLVVFTVFALPRNSDRYFMSRMVSDVVGRTQWHNTTSLDEASTWLQTYLLSEDTLFPPTFGDEAIAGMTLVGAVRLRQVRSKPQSCSAPSFLGGASGMECVPRRMSPDLEAKSELEWVHGGSEVGGSVESQLADARRFRKGSGRDTSLEFGQYSIDGYRVDLDLIGQPENTTAQLLSLLLEPNDQGETWLDLSTRFVEVAFTLYIASLDNMLGTVSLRLECGSTGEVVATHEVLCFRLDPAASDAYPSGGFKAACLLMFLFLEVEVVITFIRVGFPRILRKSSVWYDQLVGILLFVLFVLDNVVTSKVDKLNLDFAATGTFQSVQEEATLLEQESFVLSVAYLLLWMRLVKYSVLLPRFGRVTYAFMNTIRNFEVLSYVGFMFFVIIGFMFTYTIAFAQVDSTATYGDSMNLLMQLSMGEWSESAFAKLPEVVGTVMFVAFMVSVALVFVNLFISVLSEVYPREKRHAIVQCDDQVTMLMQLGYTRLTHPSLTMPRDRAAWLHKLHRAFVVPVLLRVGLVMRVADNAWNFDEPVKEFGWEKGRAFFLQNVSAIEEEVE